MAKTNQQAAIEALNDATRAANGRQATEPATVAKVQVGLETAKVYALLALADEIRTTRQTFNMISATLANIEAKTAGIEAAAQGVQARGEVMEKLGYSIVNSLSVIERH